MITFILILVFLVCMLVGIPIAFSMGLAALAAIVLMKDITLILIPIRTAMGSDSFVLLAIPLFILAGSLMETGGISRRLVRLSKAIIGHVKGGLGMGGGCWRDDFFRNQRFNRRGCFRHGFHASSGYESL